MNYYYLAICTTILLRGAESSYYHELQDPFIAALDTRDTQSMIQFAEEAATNYLEKWAMASAATAFEKDGSASWWIARRITHPALPNAVDAPEIRFKNDTAGDYFLCRACAQGNRAATDAYFGLHHAAAVPDLHADEFEPFYALLTEHNQWGAGNLYLNCHNYDPHKAEHRLKRLALAVAGLKHYPRYDLLSLFVAYSAYSPKFHSTAPYPSENLLFQDPELAGRYWDPRTYVPASNDPESMRRYNQWCQALAQAKNDQVELNSNYQQCIVQ